MRQSNPRRPARGTTLVELCIVMAMLAIIGTMVASFCALTSARTRQITSASQVREALSNVEQSLDIWLSKVDRHTVTLSTSDSEERKILHATDTAENAAPITPFSRTGIPADCVDYLTFEISGTDKDHPTVMLTCTVHYTPPHSTTQQTLTLYRTLHAVTNPTKNP